MDFFVENGVLRKYNGSEEIIAVPDDIIKIGDRAFAFCGIKEVVINNNVLFIGNRVFSYCWGLESVTIPDNTMMGYDVFENCLHLKKLTIAGKKIKVTFENNLVLGDYINNWRLTDDARILIDFLSADKNYRNFFLDVISDRTTKNMFAVYMAVEYDNEKAKAHLKENITETVKYLIDKDYIENMTKLLPLGYVTEDNIDELIKYTIENKKPEIQVFLSHYKNDNIGFASENFDKFILN